MIKVMKFGGTSLKNKKTRKKVIDIIKKETGKVLVVVSAMGRYPDAYATDTLESLISTKVTIDESNRIISVGEIISSIVLSNELKEANVKSISLSSYQAKIKIDNKQIQSIATEYIYSLFEKYDVIIIPGFQGINNDGDIEVLEKGDSDYSAVYFAQQFDCNEVTIYSDVCGIYTGDPHYILFPKLLSHVSFHQAYDLASHKARIICEKAITQAMKMQDFSIKLKSTFQEEHHTLIDNADTYHKIMSIDFDYLALCLEEPINDVDKQYIKEWIDDKAIVKKENVKNLKTSYSVISELTKLHFVGCELNNQPICINYLDGLTLTSTVEKDSYYIEKRKEMQEINNYHDTIVRDDQNV